MPPSPLTRIRKLCLALPEAHEVVAWNAPTFRVKNKMFAMFIPNDTHHHQGRYAVWLKAAAGRQEILLHAAPERFFKPPYVGPSGWVGVWLDANTDWPELKEQLREGYRLAAPKKLLAQLGDE